MKTLDSLKKKWTVFIIHHAHTDVGYTETQKRVERYHASFIRDALAIIKQGKSSELPQWKGFKWNCETFWSVEKFLERATPEELDPFYEAIREGNIGLSGSYLHFNELIGYNVLKNSMQRARNFCQRIDVKLTSLLSADITGFGAGFCRAMAETGFKNLFTCIHAVHGLYPVGKRHTPFYWASSDDDLDPVLVWIGEHYNLGNDLGIAPGAVFSYTIDDEHEPPPRSDIQAQIAQMRLPRYLSSLEDDGYPYDFLPVPVSGLVTDNAPPNPGIIEFAHEWNKEFGDKVELKMVTTDEFFDHLRTQEEPIPVYQGDWPDWWSDGCSSTPSYVRIFRQAQRDLECLRKMIPENADSDPRVQAIEQDLMLYAEHTFNHSESMRFPWHLMVKSLSARNKVFAVRAHDIATDAIDDEVQQLGGGLLNSRAPFHYCAINPFDYPIEGVAHLKYETHEFGQFENYAEVWDEEKQCVIPHERQVMPRGYIFTVSLKLDPGESRLLQLRAGKQEQLGPRPRWKRMTHDGVQDIAPLEGPASETFLSENTIETPFLRLELSEKRGITSWLAKNLETDLIRPDAPQMPFTPVYEVTPANRSFNDSDINETRRWMGRNRKGPNVQRTSGVFTKVRSSSEGMLYLSKELEFDVPGTDFYRVGLAVHRQLPRVDVTIRIHKDSVWEAENLYVALPFLPNLRKESTLWVDKAGAIVRPRVDQLPESLTDFYAIQEGLAFTSDKGGVAIATPDNHLIQLGPLEYQNRLLFGDPKLDSDPCHLYAWLMTNFWETNFEASLGGFHEFRYTVMWSPEYKDPQLAVNSCHGANQGIRTFRLYQ